MPRRILLLITDLQLGGTPTVVRELATRLARTSPDVHIEVACLSRPGPVADQLRAAGIPVTAFNASSPFNFTILPRLARFIHRNNFDTVFSFLIHANAAATFATLASPGLRLIQSIQTTQPTPRWHWHLQRLIHRAADAIVVPSASVAQVAQEWSHIPAGKIHVIPNAVDPADFQSLHHPSSSRLVLPYSIGFIGRFDPIKCIDHLLQAVAILKGRVHLHLFGQGPQELHLHYLTDKLDITNAVTFHGPVTRPQDALKKINILILPSQAEGFGLVLIEAMASKIPVVATNVPGIRDVVRPNQTGLLVPFDAPSNLAKAILRLIDDPALRDTLITQAAADVQERFSWNQVLPQYQTLLSLPQEVDRRQ